MNKRSNKINLIVCAASFVIMLCFIFFMDGGEILDSLRLIQIRALLTALGCMVAYWLLESAGLYIALKPLHKALKFRQSISVSMIGQYFNCITPFATGGQPLQAYYLHRYKVPLGSAMTALLSKFIIYQFTLTIYCIILLILRLNYFGTELIALKILTVLGFIVNLAVILGLLSLVFFKNLVFYIARFFLKLLTKIKLVKKYEQHLSFIEEQAKIYSENFSFLKRKRLVLLKLLVVSVLQLTAFFSVSYVIYSGFGLSGIDYLTVISCQSYVLMVSSFFPTPGALGASEGSYGAYFSGIFGHFTVVSMLVWRFLTFYVPLAIGLGVMLFADKHIPKEDENETLQGADKRAFPYDNL